MKTIESEFINQSFNNKADYLREDKRFEREVSLVADEIASSAKRKPVILLSGPSGSGKTTTAHMLQSMLLKKGHRSQVISLDNYFKTLSPSESENVDFEAPSRINGELLSEHIKLISECKEIELPVFDFLTKESRTSGKFFKRQKGEVVIFEGIHALNPDVAVFDESKTVKLYASVRTRVICGEKILHPKYLRLLRRMSRDSLYRGRSVGETLSFYKSVERGEELYVAPFKRLADFSIDTFIAYEPKIYKTNLLSRIESLPEKDSDVPKMLIEFLKCFNEGSNDFVVKDSVIREFIGKF